MRLYIIYIGCLLLMISACTVEEKSIYVSPNGDDSQDGSFEKPVATLTKARNLIRANRESDHADALYTVYVRGGDYLVKEMVVFNDQDHHTIYRPYENEKVRFLGGDILKTSEFFKPDPASVAGLLDVEARTEVLVADLSKYSDEQLGIIRQHGFSTAILPAQAELFWGNAPLPLARWPNNSRVRITEVYEKGSIPYEEDFSDVKPVIGYDYDRLKSWSNVQDIWLSGYFKAGYADDNIAIQSIDYDSRKMTLQQPHMFGVGKSKPGDEWGGKIRGYYAYNIKEEIDQPGEYYIDRKEKKLYIYPNKDFDTQEVGISLLEEPVFSIDGASNLTFQNFTLEYGRGMGIYLAGGEKITLESLVIRNFGTLAIMMGKGVTGVDYPIHEFTGDLAPNTVGNLKAHNYNNTDFYNEAGKGHVIKNSHFYYLGTGGMVLSGGKRKTLEKGGNLVENCEIHDFNRRVKTYCAGITLFGVGNTIRSSVIHNAPHQGIAIFGNDHLIEYNHLTNLVKDVHDNGAIYIGRNPSERGNVIRYNYFSHNGSEGFKNCAIHIDDHASDVLVEGNVFYKTSRSDFGDILINGGSYNKIRNNLFIEGAHALWVEDPAIAGNGYFVDNVGYQPDGIIHERLTNQIDIYSAPWKEAYPELIPFFESNEYALQQNVFERNVVVKAPLMVSKMNFDSAVFEVYQHNYLTNEDPGFVDYANEDFNLRSDAKVFDQIPDFEPIPFDKVNRKD